MCLLLLEPGTIPPGPAVFVEGGRRKPGLDSLGKSGSLVERTNAHDQEVLQKGVFSFLPGSNSVLPLNYVKTRLVFQNRCLSGCIRGSAGSARGACRHTVLGPRPDLPAPSFPRETRAGVQVCAEPAPSQAGGEGPCRGGRPGRAPPEVRTLDLPARRSQGEGRPLCSSFHCPWGQKNVRPDLGARGLSQNQHPRRAVLEECPARGRSPAAQETRAARRVPRGGCLESPSQGLRVRGSSRPGGWFAEVRWPAGPTDLLGSHRVPGFSVHGGKRAALAPG